MAMLRVNPTRMELSRLKRRLKTAVRGHKILKDKRDEMARQFMILIRENRRLRMEAEPMIEQALESFLKARLAMSPEAVSYTHLILSIKSASQSARAARLLKRVPSNPS